MIRLSAEQTMALEDLSLQRFVKRVANELPGYRGPLVTGRENSVLFDVAAEAVNRARSFGLQSERSLFLYANLAVTLGAAFDSDPALPWAWKIVNDDSYLGNEKMDDLWNLYMDYCAQVMGRDPLAFFPHHAFARYKTFGKIPLFDGTVEPVAEDMEVLWPEKSEFIGHDALQAHLHAVESRATEIGFRGYASRVRFCRIAFLLGYAFDADPLHSWAWPILARLDRTNEKSVISALESRFVEVVVNPCLTWQHDVVDEEIDEEDM